MRLSITKCCTRAKNIEYGVQFFLKVICVTSFDKRASMHSTHGSFDS